MSDPPLIIFDVNETLLDLETMAPTFKRIFDDKSAMRLWFSNLILYSAALTLAGHYAPFTDIGGAVMKMLADVHENQRFMAERMKARVRARPVDHAPIVTPPSAVVDIIREAIADVASR